MFIKDYLEEKEKQLDNATIANKLGISVAMISSYKRKGFNPSLSVAKRVYLLEGIVLHPYSEKGLKFEIEKDNK